MKRTLGRALLVDDQSVDLVSPSHLVHHLGYDVTLAFDGEQALTEVSRASFDLIILDWNMPSVDGGDFLRRFENRARAGGARLCPVILHTGESFLLQDFATGGDMIVDVWRKPMGALEMMNRLKKLGVA